MPASEVRSKTFLVLDCDGHIVEPGSLWTDFVEPEYRDALPHSRPGL